MSIAIEFDDEELIYCEGCERHRPPAETTDMPELCAECAADVHSWRSAASFIWTEGGAA